MSHYQGTGRTNAFKVKHNGVFEKFFPAPFERCQDSSGETQYLFFGDEEGGDIQNFLSGEPVVCVDVRSNIFNGTLFIPDNDSVQGSFASDDHVRAHVLATLSAMEGHEPSENDLYEVVDRYEDGDDMETDLLFVASEHLDDKDVLVFMSSGAEGHHFVNGFAHAVLPDGRQINVDITQIYEEITKEFGVHPSSYAKVDYDDTVTREVAAAAPLCPRPASLGERLEKEGSLRFVEGNFLCDISSLVDGCGYSLNVYDFQSVDFDDMDSLGGGEFDGSSDGAVLFAKGLCSDFKLRAEAAQSMGDMGD